MQLRPLSLLSPQVMEVLKDSLEPTLMDSILRWNPPEGYTVIENTPKSLGTLYSGNSYTAFAFLKKTDSSDDNMARQHPTSSGSVSITGMVSSEQAEINIGQTVLPNLTATQNSELVSIFSQTAMWSKLQDLEMQMLASSRKNSYIYLSRSSYTMDSVKTMFLFILRLAR